MQRANPSLHLTFNSRLRRLGPVARIKHGSHEWHRVEGETEASFKARAQAEALLPPGKVTRLPLAGHPLAAYAPLPSLAEVKELQFA